MEDKHKIYIENILDHDKLLLSNMKKQHEIDMAVYTARVDMLENRIRMSEIHLGEE